jgi:hypothetical protein
MAIQDLTDIDTDSGRPNFDKFAVEKNDQVRILVPKLAAASEYVHVFHTEAPVMETNQYGKQVPKWSRESFGGMFLCTGDAEVVQGNTRYGDPANCPACRRMHDENVQLIETPRRTFAMNVIQYATKVGDNLSKRNNNVEVKLWRHADIKKIQQLQGIAKQVKNKIHTVDILIEADNTEWKKLTIQPALDGAWYMGDEDLKKSVAGAIKNELYDADTLRAACGKPVSEDEMEIEVRRIYQRFNGASGGGSNGNGSAPVAAVEEVAKVSAPVETTEVSAAVVAEADDSTEVESMDLDDLTALID